MNPIEKMLRESLVGGETHFHDERTKESIESALMRHISIDRRASGVMDPDVAFERVVACKIQNPEFAKALSVISSAILAIFPIKDSCPVKKAVEEAAAESGPVDRSTLN